MSHDRPLPPAATPPWPAHPEPSAAAVTVEDKAGRADDPAESPAAQSHAAQPAGGKEDTRRGAMGVRTAASIGAAVGIGSASIVAALLYANRDRKPGKK